MLLIKSSFFPLYSCRPPATVLAKPAPVRIRKDSSDAEPSPPNSPSYFEEDMGDHVSSITVSFYFNVLKYCIHNFFARKQTTHVNQICDKLLLFYCFLLLSFVLMNDFIYLAIFSADLSENVKRRLTKMTLTIICLMKMERKNQ